MFEIDKLNDATVITRRPENLWYVAQDNEILVDMDKPTTSLPHVEMRLRGALASQHIDVKRVELHRSFSESHVHMLITLEHFLDANERAIWALMFHSDIYRACNTLMRLSNCVTAADLLITPLAFIRPPNYVCVCDGKHTGPVMESCPAAIALRGNDRTRSFFGRPIRVEPEKRIFPDDGRLQIFNQNVVWDGWRFR